MRVTGTVTVVIGAKRKRTASTNENAHLNSRPSRVPRRVKRLKSVSSQDCTSDSGSGDSSAMDVDPPTSWVHSDDSDTDEGSCRWLF